MRKQQRAFLYGLTFFEARLRMHVAISINAAIRTAARKYKEAEQLPSYLLVTHQRSIASLLQTHYHLVIPYFGNLALRQRKSRLIERKEDFFLSLIKEWIAREGLRKAEIISNTTRDSILKAIQDGVDQGLGNAEIARNIRKLTTLTPNRATTIARTETHAAATYGAIESARADAEDVGVVLKKIWLPTRDNRTREDHLAMLRHPPIGLDEKFNVGGVMMDRPGDTSAPAEQTIRCRCALVFEESE